MAELAAGGAAWEAEEARARAAVEASLGAGRSAVLFTSRTLVQDDGAGGCAACPRGAATTPPAAAPRTRSPPPQLCSPLPLLPSAPAPLHTHTPRLPLPRRSLEVGALVSKAICSLVHGLREPPAFLVAKGGITSNDVAVHALGVRRADVLGSVRPGVPVWQCGAESRAPGLAYVVFPGNVGAADDLARVACIVSGRGDEVWPPLPPGQAAAPATTLTAAAAVAPSAAAAAAAAAVPAPVVYPRGEALLDTLRRARERGEAVGAFNVYNLEGVLAVRRAVERVGAPAIVQLHPASLTFGGTALVAACLDVSLGCSAAPMHVQLDHAEEEAAIRLALAAGVHGLMADGSGHEAASAARDGISELEANIAWTRRMAALAHAEGAAVEAELGKLAGEEGGLELQLPPHCRPHLHPTPSPSPLLTLNPHLHRRQVWRMG